MRAIFFRCGGDSYIPFVPFPSSQKIQIFSVFAWTYLPALRRWKVCCHIRRQTSFSPPTEQRYNTLDFACRKIVCQRRFSPFGYPLVPIVVYIQIEFFAKTHPQKSNCIHKNFAKIKQQNSIVTFIFRSHDFTVHGFFIINFPCSKWKSPENPLRNSESFPDFCCSAKVFADAKNRTSASTDPVKITLLFLCIFNFIF